VIALYAVLVATTATVLVLGRVARRIGDRVARWIDPPLPRAQVRRR
jgi:hypothetical protein